MAVIVGVPLYADEVSSIEKQLKSWQIIAQSVFGSQIILWFLGFITRLKHVRLTLDFWKDNIGGVSLLAFFACIIGVTILMLLDSPIPCPFNRNLNIQNISLVLPTIAFMIVSFCLGIFSIYSDFNSRQVQLKENL